VISGFKLTVMRLPHARPRFSPVATLWFNMALFPLLRPPLHPEWRLFLLILLISWVRLGFPQNTRTKPCKRIVLLLNHLILPLLVVAMKTPLAVPDQASYLQNDWLGLTLEVPARAPVVSTLHRLQFLPPYHLLERAILQYFLLVSLLPCWRHLFCIPDDG